VNSKPKQYKLLKVQHSYKQMERGEGGREGRRERVGRERESKRESVTY
jgi:hypothetical protein